MSSQQKTERRAVARAMKNFGFSELWIVGEHPELLPVSGWWASGADDLLAAAHFAPTLLEAVADAHMTVATTSMRGRTTPVTFTPRTLAQKFASLGDDQVLALVFGREPQRADARGAGSVSAHRGDSANDAFPTMNLDAGAVLRSCTSSPRSRPRRWNASWPAPPTWSGCITHT